MCAPATTSITDSPCPERAVRAPLRPPGSKHCPPEGEGATSGEDHGPEELQPAEVGLEHFLERRERRRRAAHGSREGEEPARRFHRLCDGLVTTPLLPHWALWLWRWAQQHESVRELHGIGCRAWLGRLDETQLEQALTRALQTGILTIPVPTVQDT